MAAEALWILGGSARVEDIVPWCKNIAKYSDSGYIFQGAYGPKVAEQAHYVIETLSSDLSTRQAIINIWREMPRESLDIPCTLSLQFLHREGVLHLIVTMRSSDVWLGLPYDMFNFSMILHYIVHRLAEDEGHQVIPGNVYITAGSQHLYERNLEEARVCLRAHIPEDLTGIRFASLKDQQNQLIDMRERGLGGRP